MAYGIIDTAARLCTHDIHIRHVLRLTSKIVTCGKNNKGKRNVDRNSGAPGGSRISPREGVFLLKGCAQSAREIFKATPTFRRTTPICVRIQWLLQLQIEKLC